MTARQFPRDEVDVVHRLLEMIEHGAGMLHLFFKHHRREQVGHAIVLVRGVALAIPHQIDPGMGLFHLLAFDHELRTVADLGESENFRAMVEAEAQIPQGLVCDSGVLGVIDKTPRHEVGDEGAIDPGQGDVFTFRNDFAQFARREPAAAEAAPEFIDGVEGAGVVLFPGVEVGVISEMQVARGVPEGVAGFPISVKRRP